MTGLVTSEARVNYVGRKEKSFEDFIALKSGIINGEIIESEKY